MNPRMNPRITAAAAPVELTLGRAPVAAVDPAARTITGLVVPYEVLAARTSAGPIKFATGSIKHHPDVSRIKLLIEHDPHRSVGYGTELSQDSTGVWATFYLPEGPAGDEALAAAANRTRDGLSLGSDTELAHRSPDNSHLIVTTANLKEVSLVSLPAFDDCRVLTVKASLTDQPAASVQPIEQPAPVTASQPTPATPAPPAVTATYSTQPAAPIPGAHPTPTSHVTASTVFAAIAQTYGSGLTSARDIEAALADVVPANDAGNGFIGRSEWLSELWTASRLQRPFVDLFNDGKPLTGMKLQGWRWVTRPAVGAYAGNKAEIPSNAVATEPAEAVAYRTAGGWDIDRVFVDLGDADVVEALFRAAVEDYKRKSEAAVLSQVLAAATVVPDAATVPAALIALAAKAGTIGANLSAIGFGPDAWAKFLAISNDSLPWWIRSAGVSVDPAGQTATVGSLKLSVNDALAANQIVAADKRAARHREKTVRVNAIDLPKGGIDLGLFAYEAFIVEDARAIWKTNTLG